MTKTPRYLAIAAFLGLFPGTTHSLSAQESSAATPAPSAAPRVLRDVPYVTGGGKSQQLDLYLAPESKPRPLIVWVHGGGWQGGGKNTGLGSKIVGRGYVFASLNYRLSQEAIFPAQIEDCKAAIRWLRAHAAEYGIDPTRVGVWGESAGGHLVALLGTTGHTKQFDVGENLAQSSAVQCVVDWYGPADFLHWGDPPISPDEDKSTTAVAHLLGGTVATHEAAARAASPVYDVAKDSAPFLILHGQKDPLVPLQQSQLLDATLRQAGVESTLIVVPGARHGGPEFFQPMLLKAVADFLDSHLGVTPP